MGNKENTRYSGEEMGEVIRDLTMRIPLAILPILQKREHRL